MKTTTPNENAVTEAFDRQSVLFDALYDHNTIVRYKRSVVRERLLQSLPPHSRVLELNAGTGEDALFLARQGHRVHATDISQGMQKVLAKKAAQSGLQDHITQECCSFSCLDQLKDKGPYDLIFSNFAGLNCTGELEKVLASFPPLLKPHGRVVMVLLPGFCLWEFLLLFRGKWKTATRRLWNRKGTTAHVEGVLFKCWYYRPSRVRHLMKHAFQERSTEGLCTLVPPSYLEGFAEKYPRLYHFLKRQESLKRARWPWRGIGDYVIFSFEKKDRSGSASCKG